MSIFGHDYKGRKNLPIFHFFTRYFPKALVEITRVCVAGNAQHNKELELFDINWARGKSTDQLNTAMRHMMDHTISGPLDEEPPEVLAALGLKDGESTYHLAKAAWRILAALELQIEEDQRRKEVKAPEMPLLPLYGTPGERGHLYVGTGDYTTHCPKCKRIHNLLREEYVPGYFDPEPTPPIPQGHVWAGEPAYAGREKEPWRICPKCGGIHNMAFAKYDPGYFDPEPTPQGDGVLYIYGGQPGNIGGQLRQVPDMPSIPGCFAPGTYAK